MKNVKTFSIKIMAISMIMLVIGMFFSTNIGVKLGWNDTITVQAETVNKEADIVTYYVSTSGNNENNNGLSLETPFQTVEYAIDKAKNGDIIVIANSATANDITSLDAPLVIDKQLIIRGESTNGTLSVLSLRAGGIILGADVSFENLKIGAESFLRPGIAANGHSLTLKNVCQDMSLRPLQIYGGTFFDYNDVMGAGKDYGINFRGEESNITIIGGSFEGIYAGSTNGSFDLPVNITICETELDNPNVKYDFSVDKGIFAGSLLKNPQNTNTAGEIPALDKSILLTSVVNISIEDNAYVKNVSGVTDEHTVHLSTNGIGYYSYNVDCLDSVKVEGGTFEIQGEFGTTISNVPDIILEGSNENKATVDLSAFKNVVCNDFFGSDNGIIVLDTNGTLVIEGSVTRGITEFRTGGGLPWSSEENPGSSGWIEYEHQYIFATNGEGDFIISNPYSTQVDDIAFTPESGAENGGWITVESYYHVPEIVDFEPESVTVSFEDANSTIDRTNAIIIQVNPIFSYDESLEELAAVPVDYQITYTDINGNITVYKEQGSVMNSGYYYYSDYMCSTNSNNSEDILLTFEPIGDKIYIYASTNGLKSGEYAITMSVPTISGIMTKNFTLQVLEKSIGETLKGHSVSLDGNINVKYHFTFSEELLENTDAYAQIVFPNGKKEKVIIGTMQEKIVSNGVLAEDMKHYIDTNGYYVFTCEVAAKEMASDIIVQIFADEETQSAAYSYSVKEYAEYLLENKIEGYTDAMEKLLQAMLNYGAYAQEHFEYNNVLDKLANAGLENSVKNQLQEEMNIVLDTPDTIFANSKMNVVQNVALGTFTRANLTLESDTILNVYFKLAVDVTIDELTFKVKIGNDANEMVINPVKVGEEYLLRVADIKAHRLGETCEFIVVQSGNITEEARLSYNAFSYCYNIIKDESKHTDEIKNLCAALYCYLDKAVEYVNSR